MDLSTLMTEKSTQLVLGIVAALVIMRLILPFVQHDSAMGRLILFFWHPDARDSSRGVSAELKQVTLQNMDSTFLALLVVFALIRPFVLQAYYIPSASMEPTLYGQPEGRKDRVLVNKYIYWTRPPQRQDILVFRAPEEATPGRPPQDYIKRLIGLPGDTIEVRAHHAYINGKKLDEPYLPTDLDQANAMLADMAPVQVPAGHYFMMGDNRGNSSDSRVWGFLPAENVHGKAMCVFWPIVATDPDHPEHGRHLTMRLLH